MLYIVPTPIGNLEDLTSRAIKVFQEVDFIASEDTRHTKKLLSHFNIKTPTISFHAGSDPEKIIKLLKEGKKIALSSDAGTPCVSDPGSRLVSATYENNISVSALPGASAVITALSASGFPASHFEFFGFLPHKKGRKKILEKINNLSHTAVLYESTHRIMKFLEQAEEIFTPDRKICIARELTKIYEEYLRGTVGELKKALKQDKQRQKGEFTIIISPENF